MRIYCEFDSGQDIISEVEKIENLIDISDRNGKSLKIVGLSEQLKDRINEYIF
jgi:hypothetical protein